MASVIPGEPGPPLVIGVIRRKGLGPWVVESVNWGELRVTSSPVHLQASYKPTLSIARRQPREILCGRQSPFQLTPAMGACLSVCLQASGRRWGKRGHGNAGWPSLTGGHKAPADMTDRHMRWSASPEMASFLLGWPNHHSVDEGVGNSHPLPRAGG